MTKQEEIAIAQRRRAKVRQWREAGLTWVEIGKLLGVTRARAHQLGTKDVNGSKRV